MTPEIKHFDTINVGGFRLEQFLVLGSFDGYTISVNNKVSVTCNSNDTEATVAQKIVDVWNSIYSNQLNVVGPLNDVYNSVNPRSYTPNLIQLYVPASVVVDFDIIDMPQSTAIDQAPTPEAPTDVIQEPAKINPAILIGGGLLLLFLLDKKKKK